jgi:hypothetical protein
MNYKLYANVWITYKKTNCAQLMWGSGLNSCTSRGAILKENWITDQDERFPCNKETKKKLNSVAWVRERTISSERPLLVGEVSANFLRCHVVSVTDPYCSNLGFLDRSRYFFFQVAPKLYSRCWMYPVPDPLLLRKFGSAGNRTRTSESVAGNPDH